MLKSLLSTGAVLFSFLLFASESFAAPQDSETPPPQQTASIGGEAFDTVVLNNGQILKGKVVSQDNTQIVILFEYGTLVVPATKIKSIQRLSANNPASAPLPPVKPRSFPAWRDIVQKLTKTFWVRRFQQIPATVIEVGTLMDVPYISIRVNDDYELNIYGDPDNPAGIEMGVYRGLVNDDGAKNNCMNFIAGLFRDSDLRLTFEQLSRDSADKKENGLLTFETTPPSAPDSYGGWWITVYKEKEIVQARASKQELESISVARTGQTEGTLIDPISWTANDIQLSRTPAPSQSPAATSSTPNVVPPSTYPSTPSSSEYSTGTGRVYVKGYYRKDGTYVAPHTRSRAKK